MSAMRLFGNKWYVFGAAALIGAALFMQSSSDAIAQSLQKRLVSIRKPLVNLDRRVLDAHFRFMQDVSMGGINTVETDEFVEWAFYPVVEKLAGVETVILQVYYYSNDGHTPRIPHTPEVCYRQHGNEVAIMGNTSLRVPMPDGTEQEIPVKYLKIRQDFQGRQQDGCVMYTFCVNGEFLHDRELARIKMAMPWNRAIYFAKIECLASVPRDGDFEKAVEAARCMLTDAIPEIVAGHLPKDADLKAAVAATSIGGAESEADR